MITYSGKKVYPSGSDKGQDAPTLEDIGIGLGAAFRFRRQTEEAYPVLAHSLTVAAILPIEFAIDGLLHDAPEAILGDMPSTWKTEADEQREYELLERIYKSLDREMPSDGVVELIKVADNGARSAEAHVLGHPAASTYWPNPNSKIMQITERHLEFAESMLNAKTAAMLFTEAYDHYSDLANNPEPALS